LSTSFTTQRSTLLPPPQCSNMAAEICAAVWETHLSAAVAACEVLANPVVEKLQAAGDGGAAGAAASVAAAAAAAGLDYFILCM
jgi:hypothetical protein